MKDLRTPREELSLVSCMDILLPKIVPFEALSGKLDSMPLSFRKLDPLIV